jgi:hypothetical protein
MNESGLKAANNTINASNAQTGLLTGIYHGQGSNVNIYKNEIYDLSSTSTSSAAGLVNGIMIGGGTNVYVYNNFISELKTPSASNTDAIRGIAVTSAQVNSAIGIYYNTVYLNASSSGANFGTSGIYHASSTTATTVALDLRNNIIVNISVPNGTAFTAAFRRSAAATDNYKPVSNNNIFYAGAPGTYKVIYFDGTSRQTIEDYKALVGPGRDSVSYSEDPVFMDVSTSPYDLRLQDGNITYCESGARPVSAPLAITTDFDGAARPSTPDIGADEFSGTAAYVHPPSVFSAACAGQSQINISWTRNVNNQDVIITSQASAMSGNPVNGTVYNVGDAVPSAGTVIYKGPALAFSQSGLGNWSQQFYKSWSLSSYNYYSPGITASAVTDADTVETLPYYVDFDVEWLHSPSAPDQWKVFNADGASTPAWRKDISYFHLGPACAEGSGNNNDYLVSPPISLPDTNCRVYWWDRVENASDNNTYRIMVSTTGSEPAAFTVSLDTFNCTNTTWTRHELNLSQYKGQTVFLAFHQYYSANPNSGFAIDEVRMDTLPLGTLFSQWQGSVSNNWADPANWSDGIPGVSHQVIISTDMFDPILDSSASVYSITVEPGSVFTVTDEGDLTVTGD